MGEEKLKGRFFDETEMYADIEAYAKTYHMEQTLRALPYAKQMHEGQFRSGKHQVPYIYHPLLVASHAIALGMGDDDMVATALLHDVCEDCGVLPDELPVGDCVKEAVALLTKPKGKLDNETYYSAIATNEIAVMVKILDRCSNISSITDGFGQVKISKYIIETEEWVYPLLQNAKETFPAYADVLFIVQYHMASVIEGLRRFLSPEVLGGKKRMTTHPEYLARLEKEIVSLKMRIERNQVYYSRIESKYRNRSVPPDIATQMANQANKIDRLKRELQIKQKEYDKCLRHIEWDKRHGLAVEASSPSQF